MGILQLISLSDEFNEKVRKSRYLRTPSMEKPSEATVMYYPRRTIFLLMLNSPDSPITEIIRSKQEKQSGTRLKKTGIITPGNTGFTIFLFRDNRFTFYPRTLDCLVT